MAFLLEHKAKSIFITASTIKRGEKSSEIVIEHRPQFAIVHLNGSRERFPIPWEVIYDAARKRHEENVRLEAKAKHTKHRKRDKTVTLHA